MFFASFSVNYYYLEMPALLIILSIFINICYSQLIINVRNRVGDILQETISTNTSSDTVTLEFQRPDGTLVTQIVDFKNEVQVLKSLILAEEERGQSQYQVVCFVFYFQKDSFISPDAMAKLRQKNPSTIRTPERDLGRINYTMNYNVLLEQSDIISPVIKETCVEAGQSIYTGYQDIVQWSNAKGLQTSAFNIALKSFPTKQKLENGTIDDLIKEFVKCTSTKEVWKPCVCDLELCIAWYPCDLKYCKSKNLLKNPLSTYRCGIKTCKLCHRFTFYTELKQQCLWDDQL